MTRLFSSSTCSMLLASLLMGGCASAAHEGETGEDMSADALAAPSVVVARSAATAVAVVEEDRIVLPLGVADPYRTLRAGSIFVGARGGSSTKNPDGFLRRVSSVVQNGDALVIATTRASLTDAIVHGAVRASSKGNTEIDRDAVTGESQQLAGIAVDFSGQSLFDNVDEIEVAGKKVRFTESVHLDRAIFASKPSVDLDLRIEDGKVQRFVSKVEGNLDTSILATATVTADGETDPAVLAELAKKQHEITRVIYRSPKVALPSFAVGGVPVSPSVLFTVTLRCQISFGGALVAHAGVDAKSQVRLGGVYEDGAWQAPIKSDFAIAPSFTMDQGGAIAARCAVEADAMLSAYGEDSGITMSVAPYVDFGVKREGVAGYAYRVDAGAEGSMAGRADVFGMSPEDLERKLVEWKAPALLEGTRP